MSRASTLTLACLWLLACSSSTGGQDEESTGIMLTNVDVTSGDGDGDAGDGDPTGDGDPGDGDGDDTKYDLLPPPDGEGMGELGLPETCADAEAVESAVGCVFFGLDADNTGLGEPEPFGIVVSNIQDAAPAEAVVEEKQNGSWVTLAGPVMIQPLDSHVFMLPDNHHEGSARTVGGAYRVTTDVPVVAYEFNPIDGQASHTTDASLLFPTHSYDYLYEVVGYPVTVNLGSYVILMAAVDGALA